MNDGEILEKLIQILKKSTTKEVADVDFDSDLRMDLGIESVGMMFLAVMIEKEFNVSFEGVELDSFKKVSDVVEFIRNKC